MLLRVPGGVPCLCVFVACILEVFVFDGLQFHSGYLGVILKNLFCMGFIGLCQSLSLISSGKFAIWSSNITSVLLFFHFLSGTLVKHVRPSSILLVYGHLFLILQVSLFCFISDQGLAYGLYVPPLPAFVNKVLSEHSHILLFTYCL